MTPNLGPRHRRLLALALVAMFTAPLARAQTATNTPTRTPTRTPSPTRTPRPPTPTRTPTPTPTAKVYLGTHYAGTMGSRLRWTDGYLYVMRTDGSYSPVILYVTETPTPTPTP